MIYFFPILFFLILFIFYFWLCWFSVAARGAFSSGWEWGPLSSSASIALASLVGHRALGGKVSAAAAHRLCSCGSQAKWLQGTWNLPGPGIELISPVSQGKFLTTGPPGKPFAILLFVILNMRSVSRLPWWSSGYDFVFPLQGAQIWSLFRELRSCMLCRTAKLIIVKLFLLFYLKSVSCKRAIVGSCFFNPTWQCNDWIV